MTTIQHNPPIDQNIEILPLNSMAIALEISEKEVKSYMNKKRYSLNDILKIREMMKK